MRTHLDKSAVALARARISIGITASTGRCAARRSGKRPDLRAADPHVLLALADDERRTRIVKCAAAARHGAEIARAVSGAARAELKDIMDDETRRFALAHRCKGTSTEDGAFQDRYAASCADIETLLRGRLSGEDAPDAALDAALAL